MADFLVTLKFQIDSPDVPAGKGGGGSGGGGGGSSNQVAEEIRKAFSQLTSEIKAANETFKQVITAVGALKNAVATGSKPQSVRPDVNDTSSSNNAAAVAADKAADAIDRLSVAEEKEAKAAAGAAREVNELADSLKNVAEAAKAATEAATNTAEASSRAAESATKNIRFEQGRANLFDLFNNVIKDVANNPALRDQALATSSKIAGFFKVDNFAGKEIQELTKRLERRLQREFKDIDIDPDSITVGKRLARIRQEFELSARDLAGVEKPLEQINIRFDMITKTLKSRAFVNLVDQADKAAKEVARLEGLTASGGASEGQVRQARNSAEDLIAGLRDFIRSELNSTSSPFKVVDRAGAEIGDISGPLRQFIEAGPDRVQLNTLQRQVRNILTDEKVLEPLKRVQNAFSLLAREGKFNELESNIRVIRESLKGFSATTAESAQVLKETNRLFNLSRTNTGNIKLPTKVDQATSIGLNTSFVDAARRSLVGAPRGAERGFRLDVVDASGNVKKVDIALKQLGDTLDTIKVKARDVSANMFDRASVTEALRRVATWGAAAGIVFGTVDALKSGLNVIFETETGVVALAKVMSESARDFEGFTLKAREAAIAISQEFGQPIKDVLDTLINFGQQGLDFSSVQELTRASALASVATNLSQPQAADALTAALAQFNKEGLSAIRIVDAFNKVSNENAVTEKDLAEAIKRAGLAAQTAGVSFDEFNGVVTAIIESTRQTGAEVGTALRFIFTRLLTPEAERGFAQIGISLRSTSGEFRGFTNIITELSQRWDSLTDTQKANVAIAAAGTRRYNTFLALMDDFSGFQSAAADSANSLGSALKESERVAETSAFKLQQLKNSLVETALSAGDTLQPAIKGSLELLKTFTDVLNTLPSSVKAVATGLAIGGVAFARFGDTVTQFLDFVAGTGKGARDVGRGIAASLTQGVSLEQQAQTFTPGKLFQLGQVGQLALSVPDLIPRRSQDDVKSFSQVLKENNRVLLDTRGNIIDTNREVGKFTAVVKGFKVGELDQFGNVVSTTALGLGTLNSGLSKTGAFVLRLSDSFLKFSVVGRVFDVLEGRIKAIQTGTGALAFSLAKVGTAAALIVGAVEGYRFLRDEITQTGTDVKKSLEPELAARQEALNLVEKERSALTSLREAQIKFEQRPVRDRALQQEDIRRGTFQSPFLQQQRLSETRQQSVNQIGAVSPQLIESIDELGNITLSSAASFDKLAESAVSAQKALFSLTQAKVIEGFVGDLKPAEGFLKKGLPDALRAVQEGFESFIDIFTDVDIDTFDNLGKTLADKLKDARSELDKLLKGSSVTAARDLGIDVRLLDAGAADRLRDSSARLAAASLEFKSGVKRIQEELNSLPADAPEQIFQAVFRRENAEVFRQIERLRSTETGTPVAAGSFAGQQFLRNSGDLRSSRNLIGLTADETIGRFNEARVIEQVVEGRDNIRRALEQASGAQLVLFKDIEGIPRQAILEVTKTGERQIKFFSEQAGKVIKQSAEEISRSASSITLLDAKKISDEVRSSLFEINRVATGALRGSVLNNDIELGPRFASEGSSQQRAAVRDEVLAQRTLTAQREFQRALEQFGGENAREEGADVEFVTPEVVLRVRQLALEFDKFATVFRFRSEIEELNKSIEEGARELSRTKIADKIREQLSTVFGAESGLVPRRFSEARLGSELSVQQRFDTQNPEVVRALNSSTDLLKSLQETAIAAAQTERDIGEIARDFFSSTDRGGVNDPSRVSSILAATEALAGRGIDQATAIQNALIKEQVDIQSRQLTVLQQILDKGTTLTPAQAVAAARQIGSATPSSAVERLVSQLNGSNLEQFSPQDLREIITKIPRELFSSQLTDAFAKASARETANTLAQNAVMIEDLVRRSGNPQGGVAPSQTTQTLVSQRNDIAAVLEELIKTTGVEILKSTETAQRQVSESDIRKAAIEAGKAFIREGSAIRGRSTNLTQAAENARVAEGIEAQGRRIVALAESGNSTLIESVRGALEQARVIRLPEAPARVNQAPPIDVKQQEIIARATAQATSTVTVELGKLASALGNSTALVELFGRKVGEAFQGVQDGFAKAVVGLEALRGTRAFTAPLTGALAGVNVPNTDLGRNRQDLSGIELTSLENPRLAEGLQELEFVAQSLLSTLQDVEQLRGQALLRQSEALQSGDPEKIRQAEVALQGVASASQLVKEQLGSTQDSLRSLRDAFKDLAAINDLRVNIEGLLRSFQKSQFQLRTDTTSIDTALGRSPFSFSRPTFDQASRGQSGALDRFQRQLADLSSQFRSGEIGFSELQRGRSQVGFERGESVIQFVQDRENKLFESQVQTAQQIQSSLFDFVQRGGAGSDQARGLLQQITGEIERAGDITRISGSRSVRNPITGQRENVPAGSLFQFRGIPSLEKFDDEIARLAEQFRRQDIEDRARAVADPIVDALNNGSITQKLEDINNTLKTGADEQVRTLTGGLNLDQANQEIANFARNLSSVIDTLVTGQVSDRGAADRLVDLNSQFNTLPTELKEAVLSSRLDANRTLGEAFRAVDTTGSPEAAQAIQGILEGTSNAFSTVVKPFDESVQRFIKAVADFSQSIGGTVVGSLRQATGFATGGMISGPGGPTQDKVPIMASPGEFILNAKAVSRLGVPFLQSLNSFGSYKGAGGVGRFAGGGFISGYTTELKTLLEKDAQLDEALSNAQYPGEVEEAFERIKRNALRNTAVNTEDVKKDIRSLSSFYELYQTPEGRKRLFEESDQITSLAGIGAGLEYFIERYKRSKVYRPSLELAGRRYDAPFKLANLEGVPSEVGFANFLDLDDVFAGPGGDSILDIGQAIINGRYLDKFKQVQAFVEKAKRSSFDFSAGRDLISEGSVFSGENRFLAAGVGLAAGIGGGALDLTTGVGQLALAVPGAAVDLATGKKSVGDIVSGAGAAAQGIVSGIVDIPKNIGQGAAGLAAGLLTGDNQITSAGAVNLGKGGFDAFATFAGGPGVLKQTKATAGLALRGVEAVLPSRIAGIAERRIGAAAERFGLGSGLRQRGEGILAGRELQRVDRVIKEATDQKIQETIAALNKPPGVITDPARLLGPAREGRRAVGGGRAQVEGLTRLGVPGFKVSNTGTAAIGRFGNVDNFLKRFSRDDGARRRIAVNQDLFLSEAGEVSKTLRTSNYRALVEYRRAELLKNQGSIELGASGAPGLPVSSTSIGGSLRNAINVTAPGGTAKSIFRGVKSAGLLGAGGVLGSALLGIPGIAALAGAAAIPFGLSRAFPGLFGSAGRAGILGSEALARGVGSAVKSGSSFLAEQAVNKAARSKELISRLGGSAQALKRFNSLSISDQNRLLDNLGFAKRQEIDLLNASPKVVSTVDPSSFYDEKIADEVIRNYRLNKALDDLEGAGGPGAAEYLYSSNVSRFEELLGQKKGFFDNQLYRKAFLPDDPDALQRLVNGSLPPDELLSLRQGVADQVKRINLLNDKSLGLKGFLDATGQFELLSERQRAKLFGFQPKAIAIGGEIPVNPRAGTQPLGISNTGVDISPSFLSEAFGRVDSLDSTAALGTARTLLDQDTAARARTILSEQFVKEGIDALEKTFSNQERLRLARIRYVDEVFGLKGDQAKSVIDDFRNESLLPNDPDLIDKFLSTAGPLDKAELATQFRRANILRSSKFLSREELDLALRDASFDADTANKLTSGPGVSAANINAASGAASIAAGPRAKRIAAGVEKPASVKLAEIESSANSLDYYRPPAEQFADLNYFNIARLPAEVRGRVVKELNFTAFAEDFKNAIRSADVDSLNKLRIRALELKNKFAGLGIFDFEPANQPNSKNPTKANKFALGGLIDGLGGPKSDRVPIMASPGEFIVNADSVSKIGLPILEYLNNSGTLPKGFIPKKFQTGGLVGGSGSGSNQVSINTQEIASAVSKAITDALQSQQVSLDASAAVDSITRALASVEVPIRIDEQNLPTLKVDAPESIKLDTSSLQGLNVGGALGADVVNRLEAIEGSTTALREDVNEALGRLTTIPEIDFTAVSRKVDEALRVIEPISTEIAAIKETVAGQERKILDQTFFLVNEQISQLDLNSDVEAKVERFKVEVQQQLTKISGDVTGAVATANQAMTRALAR